VEARHTEKSKGHPGAGGGGGHGQQRSQERTPGGSLFRTLGSWSHSGTSLYNQERRLRRPRVLRWSLGFVTS
jgi:hypothetical protein